MEGRTRLVLDVDTGTDDAMALLLALRSPTAEVLAVTCVHGNADVGLVLENTLKVLDEADAPPDLPVACGFDKPLVEPVTHCPQIHGFDGLGDLQPPLPASQRKPRPEHAVELLNATLKAAEGPVTIVGLAPLTNIAVAFRMNPRLWHSKVDRLVWMGGAVACGGNATACAEANSRYDPEAAHIVLNSGIPLMIYPWDTFLKVGFTKDELCAMGILETASAGLAGRLLWRELRHFGGDEAVIGDAGAVAAALLLRAGSVTTRKLHVAVELQGSHTRGMTACDLRAFVHPPDAPQQPANVEVVMDVDVPAVKSFFSTHVLLSKSGPVLGACKRKRDEDTEAACLASGG